MAQVKYDPLKRTCIVLISKNGVDYVTTVEPFALFRLEDGDISGAVDHAISAPDTWINIGQPKSHTLRAYR